MTDTIHDETALGTQENRYGAFETGDGDVVVYDCREPTAWIQSDYAVEFGPQ
ncbi:hypothetical protein VB773_04670 [Haloarculaceae archaeon H-GB2-1]|nr:hypothetical protein [Haloarculaceae archaeon H-GB1-1]MEA5388891.1 hypothetical protein [Haloarculaceae archaeon H-GB11]MEA5406944.1 hypothetical protein [Haloarculaceae archaeon H-GB2-1]